VIFAWNRLGVASIETPGKAGRHHAYLSIEEERNLLLPFFERAEKGELMTVLQTKQAFEERVGHEVNERTVGRLLEWHGWRKLVPRPFHPQAEKEKQTQLKQDFKTLVEDAIQTRDPTDQRPVLVMAQDEACFGRISILRRSWVPKHKRPSVPRQFIREYIYVYAASAPETGKMISLILPSVDTAMMNIFLQHVSRVFSEYFLVIQVD
jgi:winged helix-turn-helix protein